VESKENYGNLHICNISAFDEKPINQILMNHNLPILSEDHPNQLIIF